MASITRINTLLTTDDTVTNTKILSTLNFETSAPPQPACEIAFDPMQYVVAELFRGHELHVEQIGGTFSVQNKTSFSMAESLMTVVLRPADTESAYSTTPWNENRSNENHLDQSLSFSQKNRN